MLKYSYITGYIYAIASYILYIYTLACYDSFSFITILNIAASLKLIIII